MSVLEDFSVYQKVLKEHHRDSSEVSKAFEEFWERFTNIHVNFRVASEACLRVSGLFQGFYAATETFREEFRVSLEGFRRISGIFRGFQGVLRSFVSTGFQTGIQKHFRVFK